MQRAIIQGKKSTMRTVYWWYMELVVPQYLWIRWWAGDSDTHRIYTSRWYWDAVYNYYTGQLSVDARVPPMRIYRLGICW